MMNSAALRCDVARAGRKRKSGNRKASGDLIRDKQPDDRVRTARQPHRRTVRAEFRMSEHAESPLGRYMLRWLITEQQMQAGIRFAVVVGAYRSIIEAPAGTSVADSGARGECYVNTDGFCNPTDCRCLRKREQYDSAFEALSTAGQRPAKTVARVAVHREAIAREDLVYLVIGLNALARHFGLTHGQPGA